ncbi:MAG: hypothetical protein K2H88_04510 [Duncaniella sp.]|nr:hypothetical protein [Duncaniella sp.]
MTIAIISIMLLLCAATLSFSRATYAAVTAFLGLCATGLLPGETLPLSGYIFWAVAMLIVVALGLILPPAINGSRIGTPYVCGASMAGMLVGLATSSHAAMVAGAFIGAVLGGIAFAKTPAGKILEFPTSKFLNYLCAKGLPVVVTMSIIGTAAAVLIAAWPS